MNDTVVLILSYLPAAISLVGSVAAAVMTIKKCYSKFDEAADLRHKIAQQNKRLAKAEEDNIALRQEIHNLILEMRGIHHVKENVKKN